MPEKIDRFTFKKIIEEVWEKNNFPATPSFDFDSSGQIVIYTDLAVDENSEIVEWEG